MGRIQTVICPPRGSVHGHVIPNLFVLTQLPHPSSCSNHRSRNKGPFSCFHPSSVCFALNMLLFNNSKIRICSAARCFPAHARIIQGEARSRIYAFVVKKVAPIWHFRPRICTVEARLQFVLFLGVIFATTQSFVNSSMPNQRQTMMKYRRDCLLCNIVLQDTHSTRDA